MIRLAGELWGFVWGQKKYWLIPIILALIIIGLLVVVGELAPISPFVYPMF